MLKTFSPIVALRQKLGPLWLSSKKIGRVWNQSGVNSVTASPMREYLSLIVEGVISVRAAATWDAAIWADWCVVRAKLRGFRC